MRIFSETKINQAELRRSGFEDLVAAGVVLTGGSSKMEGVVELAEEIFHMPVSLGFPKNISGLKDIVTNPIYSTGVGLLAHAKEIEQRRSEQGNSRTFGLFSGVKKWLDNNV